MAKFKNLDLSGKPPWWWKEVVELELWRANVVIEALESKPFPGIWAKVSSRGLMFRRYATNWIVSGPFPQEVMESVGKLSRTKRGQITAVEVDGRVDYLITVQEALHMLMRTLRREAYQEEQPTPEV